MIEAFSNLAVSIADGNTVPSVDIGNRFYVDIGSGTILKVFWDTPIATGNHVDYYTITLVTYDRATNSYKTLLNTPIGKVNEFYVTSDMLVNVTMDQYQLDIYLTANSRYGPDYDFTANVVSACISKGCGTYLKVTEGYQQPVMKRSLAMAKLPYVLLLDVEGKVLKDSDGKVLYAKSARVQDATIGWALMQEFSAKDTYSTWRYSDIQYEVITDVNGEIITDMNNEPIYVL